MASTTSLLESLENKSMLVTGSTGFLAKVFVEKVLRVQPQVKIIFLLLRAADEATAIMRFQNEVLKSELFSALREAHKNDLDSFISEKVYLIAGDVAFESLGIKDAYAIEFMQKEINVIVNSAGNTKFDERYDLALGTNTLGAKHVLEFSKKCKKLELLLHVSTAYAAGDTGGTTLEKPFGMGEALNTNMNLDIEAEFDLVQKRLNESHIKDGDKATQRNAMKEMGLERARLFGWANTYVFTKAMGEMLLGQFRENLPLVIIRPSMVTSTLSDPFPGWIEGIRTIDSMVVGYAKGRLMRFLGEPNAIVDVIPVNMVVNAMIVSIACYSAQPVHIIYHMCSSGRNPVKSSQLADWGYKYFTCNPCIGKGGNPIKGFRIANGLLCQAFNKRYNNASIAYKRVMHMARLYEPFAFFKGIFDDLNSAKLREMVERAGEQSKMFEVDPKHINWEDYFIKVHFPGVVKYLIK